MKTVLLMHWFLCILLASCASSAGVSSSAAESATSEPESPTAVPIADTPLASETRPLSPTPGPTGPTPAPTIGPTLIVLPTFGPFPTLPRPSPRTPSAPAECPRPSGTQPTITPPQIPQQGAISKGFEASILAYLNTKGSSQGLLSALSVQSVEHDSAKWHPNVGLFLADINHDAEDEVLVTLVFSSEGYEFTDGWLWVFACDNGSYVPVYDQFLGSWTGSFLDAASTDGIRDTRDMNRDGTADLVLSHIDNCGTHANCTRVFRILGWNGTTLADLAFSSSFYAGEPFPGIYAFNGDGFVRDTNADGYLELITSNGITHYYPDIGPERARTDIWGWNGRIFTLVRWEHTPPVYRIHAVWDGDDASLFGKYDDALAFYQQAIFDEGLLGWSPGQFWRPKEESWFWEEYRVPPLDAGERPRLSAYARYRILLLHILEGREVEAQLTYDTLQDRFPHGSVGSQYAVLARVFWDEYVASSRLEAACARANEYSASQQNEIILPLYEPYNRFSQPSEICPFTP